jgi:uncharacterized membrane protein
MGFDDLAKHMAARDGRKKVHSASANADQIVTEAIKADQRMNRIRDLVLGPILLVGGLGIEVLVFKVAAIGADMIGIGVLAAVAIIVGLMKTIRGLTSRKLIGDAPEQIMEQLESGDLTGD